MPRPKVRHCKECIYLEDKTKRYFTWDRAHALWVCKHPGYEKERQERTINGKEVRTCPLWCPMGRKI